MINHHQLQDVVDIDPSGTYAYGRFQMLMFGGVHSEAVNDNPQRYDKLPRQWIEQGMYENEYRKENGVWKCCVFRYKEIWTAPFELSAGGWAEVKRGMLPYEALMTTVKEGNPVGPDEKVPENAWVWPERRVFKYHYPHPVGNVYCLWLSKGYRRMAEGRGRASAEKLISLFNFSVSSSDE